jgi:acetoin utilization deacetylase AcuC-like enzyme
MLSTGDTNIGAKSLEIARLAAGSVFSAVEEVMAGRITNAFCIVRPPGHHATQSRGMGFCVFNNVALAARYAQKKHGIGNVLIVDWDAHHGNGTEQIFYDDDRVFYFSTHLYPWYPGTGARGDTGAGKGIGRNLNAPFPPGTPAEEVMSAYQNELVPRMKQFKPELVLISAGFDSRAGDPLGGLQLTDRHFAELTLLLCRIAREHASSRLVSVLEGGYSLDGLAKAAVAHVKALMEGAASACT